MKKKFSLIGREQEINEIKSLVGRIGKGESFFLLVSAEEGVGKISLINAALQQVEIKFYLSKTSNDFSSPLKEVYKRPNYIYYSER